MTQLSSHNIGQQLKAFTIRKSLIFTIAIASLGIVIATVFSWLGQNPVAIAGALDIKDTDYPVPAGAIFVATTGTNDGSCGQEVSPCQTIQYAISNRATSGDTIVIRGGTYHESVAFNMPLTLQPYPHEKVWLDGAQEVTGWVADGSTWRKDNWTYLWTDSGGDPYGETISSNYIDPNFPMAGWPDMVFIDGEPLRQVGAKAFVEPGTFFVDYDNEQLFIGDNPTGVLVEAATLNYGIEVLAGAGGSTIRGMGIKRYANAVPARGMVHTHPTNLTFENNTFAQSASLPIKINYGDGSVMRGNIIIYNGISGGSVFQTDNFLFEQNYSAFNNTELFDYDWEAGGIKMVAIRNSIIRENIFEHNNGTGYWCDISCLNVDIVRNLSISNKRHGYFYEISSTSIIASNVAADNEGSGIHVMGSNHVDVYNNTLVNNKRNLFVGDENRKNTNPTEIAEGNDWDTHNVKVINNILSGNNGSTDANVDGGSQLLAVANYETGQPTADTFFTTIDYNAYYRANSAIPRDVVAYWTGASGTPAYWLTAETLAEFQAYTQGYEQHGVIVDGNPIHPWFEDVDAGDYHLATGVSLIGAGQPIPSSVANAINSGLGTAIVTAESTIDVGAIQWIEELTVPGDLPEPTPTPTPIPTPTPTPTPVGDRGGATSIQGGTRIQGGASISGNE